MNNCFEGLEGRMELKRVWEFIPKVGKKKRNERVKIIREDDHLCLLSSELKHLDIGIAALSEVRRPDCGEIIGSTCWTSL